MNARKTMLTGLVTGLMLAGGALAQTPDVGAAGRKIMETYKDAVVKVKVVLQTTMSYNGKEAHNSESKSEVTGTVVDPSGLVLVSLSSIDPSRITDSVMAGMGKQNGFKVETRVNLKDVKIVLPDNSELDAAVATDGCRSAHR